MKPLKGQATIFIIVGLVLVLTTALLIYVASSAQTTEEPEIQTSDITVEQCLEASTDLALQALQEQGSLTGHRYIKAESSAFLLGRSDYLGLCSRQGANPINTQRSCNQKVYARPGTESIQYQIKQNITAETQECTGDNQLEVEVLLARDQITVRSAQDQYTRQVPLTSTWAAIKDFLFNETRDTTYYTGGALEIQACPDCEFVTVEQENPSSAAQDTKHYRFSVGGELIARIPTENRGLVWVVGNTIHEGETCDGSETVVYSIDRDGIDLTSSVEGPDQHFKISCPQAVGEGASE